MGEPSRRDFLTSARKPAVAANVGSGPDTETIAALQYVRAARYYKV